MKTITLYQSILCPRCYIARKALHKLTQSHGEIELEKVEILYSLKRLKQDRITMIPAIKVGDKVLSGLYLNEQAISHFLRENKII